MKTFGPYSAVVKTGDLYFVSGQIGVDPHTGQSPQDVQAQTSQAMCNMKDALQKYDLDMDNIVKTTIYVTNMGDFDDINDIYQGFFADPKPARATVAVKELPRVSSKTILVEIEAVAAKGKRTRSLTHSAQPTTDQPTPAVSSPQSSASQRALSGESTAGTHLDHARSDRRNESGSKSE